MSDPDKDIEFMKKMVVGDTIGITLFNHDDKPVVAVALMYTPGRILIEVSDKGHGMWDRAKEVKAMIKDFDGRKYHGFEGEEKDFNGLKRQSWNWSIRNTERNMTQLLYMMGGDPYYNWDQDMISREELDARVSKKNGWDFDPYDHQFELAQFAATYHHCIFGAEPGTGKTLAMFMALEYLNRDWNFKEGDIWYIGPKSATRSLPLELEKWRSGLPIKVDTYNGLVSTLLEWEPGMKPPRAIIFDECQRLKTITSQRTIAAKHIANSMRMEYGMDCLILGMSGTPAPNTPCDWWAQCEVMAPGFIKEGSVWQFKSKLQLVEQRENLQQGGTYPHIVTWWDDEAKCGLCGALESDPRHVSKSKNEKDINAHHCYRASENRIEELHQRLNGLVMIKLKKDCLDLPDIQYITQRVRPTKDQFRLYKMAKDKEDIPIKMLNEFRKISDGFDYVFVDNPEKLIDCDRCKGEGEYNIPKMLDGDMENTATHEYEDDIKQCPKCKGTKEMLAKKRDVRAIPTAKDEALSELMDTYYDVGRLVVWAGFQASIDKLSELCRQKQWHVLKADGRGWFGITPHGDPCNPDDLLKAMDQSHPEFKMLKNAYPRIVVVGHPEAAGTAVTFTAAPAAIYYSNTFKGEDRIQSEQRIHRAGMDLNRACVIYDLVCLPADLLVVAKLKKKRNMERMSMGVLLRELEDESYNNEETI